MEGKARFIFPILVTAIVVLVVSGVVRFVNIGFRGDFIRRWLFAFGWPIASVVAFLALPIAQRVTALLIGLIEGP